MTTMMRLSHNIQSFTVTLGTFCINLLIADSPEIVQYSHRAKRDDEIDLVIGDIVLVFEMSEDGRCKGVIGEREGWFPGDCTTERTYNCCTVVYHLDLKCFH